MGGASTALERGKEIDTDTVWHCMILFFKFTQLQTIWNVCYVGYVIKDFSFQSVSSPHTLARLDHISAEPLVHTVRLHVSAVPAAPSGYIVPPQHKVTLYCGRIWGMRWWMEWHWNIMNEYEWWILLNTFEHLIINTYILSIRIGVATSPIGGRRGKHTHIYIYVLFYIYIQIHRFLHL